MSSEKRPHLEEDRPDDRKRMKDGIGSTVANHYNRIEEKGLKAREQSRIFHMRNYNNWIKSILLLKYMNKIRDEQADDHRIVVMDLGCGKGGDLFKWQKAGIRHLICADIAKTSVSQCQERYNSMRNRSSSRSFSAEFMVADCTKTLLFSKGHQIIDLVSCQFVFHYSFESLNQAETMVKNASMSLRMGGFFLLTIPDANRILSKLEESKSNTFGNEVYRIEFPKDRSKSPPLFGDVYNFFLEGVVNCPEFLVHVPTLEKICAKYGLEMIYKKSFTEIYAETQSNRENQILLMKMKCLESYPSTPNAVLSTDLESEYEHAREHIDTTGDKEVQTMSSSEWEAISLYQAIVFQRIK